MGGERVAPHFPPHPVGRPHVADGFSCVGDVAPTYDIPVGRPHAADGFSAPRGFLSALFAWIIGTYPIIQS